MSIKSFTEYYSKSVKIIFIILSISSIGLNLLIMARVTEPGEFMFYLNVSSIIVYCLLLLLHFRFRASLNLCFTTGVYVTVLIIFLSHFLNENIEGTEIISLFRHSIFLLLILMFAGIVLHRAHAIIIFVITTIRLYSTSLLDNQSELANNMPILILAILGVTVTVYLFSGKLHDSINEIQLNQKQITDKNRELQMNTEELQAAMEDLSVKNESLQDLNISKDKFFTIISHDLKNPLNTLSGFIDILISKSKKLLPEKRDLYMTHVKASADNIQNLLNDLLEWSRSQTNQIKCEPININMFELAESVFYFLKQVGEEKGVEFFNAAQKEHQAFADYNMIFTVLRNLVSNSIKFSTKGKKITIYTELLNNGIKTYVLDEGIGIRQEDKEVLFKIDSNVSTEGTNHESGTGLGLLLCKEFVDKNGGAIGLDSEEGKGARFWFSLPLCKT